MAKIAGVLKDPAGHPLVGWAVQLIAQRTTLNTFKYVFSDTKASDSGAYSIDVPPGVYDVVLSVSGTPPKGVGQITVLDNSGDGTLNDFLLMSNPSDFNHELLAHFQQIRNDIKQSVSGAENVINEAKDIQTQLNSVKQEVTEQLNETTDKLNEFDSQLSHVGDLVEETKGYSESTLRNAAESVTALNSIKQEKSEAETLLDNIYHHIDELSASASSFQSKIDSGDEIVTSMQAIQSEIEQKKTAIDQTAESFSTIKTDIEAIENKTQTATLEKAGIVQLSSATNSANETTAATSKAVQSLRSELKSTPFLPDFASFNIESGIYHALGDGTPSPSLNGPVGTGNNVLTVTVRNGGKSVVHFEVIQNSHGAPVKWIGEYFGQNPAMYWTKVITTSNIAGFMPAGMPQPWPNASVPTGWLKCNGAAFDKIKYPELAKAYPSGALPDLRGEFIRGWDDGRGVDAGRGVLSSQGDAIRNITGSFGNIMWPAGQSGGVGVGVFLAGQNLHGMAFEVTEQSMVNKGVGTDGILFNASRVVPTANENRPRNIAFLYIVSAA